MRATAVPAVQAGAHLHRREAAAVALEDALHDPPDPRDVPRDLLLGEHRPLRALAARVADEARRAAEQRDGVVAASLEPGEDDDAEEVPDVNRIGRRVEADIHREPLRGGGGAEVVGGDVLDEFTLPEHLENVAEGRRGRGICSGGARLV